MSDRLRRVLVLAMALALGVVPELAFGVGRPPPPALPHDAVGNDGGALPLLFVDHGPGEPVRFSVHGRDSTALLGPSGITLLFAEDRAGAAHGGAVTRAFTSPPASRMSLMFEDASAQVRLVGLAKAETIASWFRGPADRWRTGLPTFGAVEYRDLWPGIDLRLDGATGRLKYSFTVAPGADASRIRLTYDGASSVTVSPSGQLLVRGAGREVLDDRPVAFSEDGDRRVPVPVAFARTGRTSYGFRVGLRDPDLPLVIDPVLPVYAGLVGGGANERGLGVAVDGTGAAYMTGHTSSTVDGSDDAYLAKVAPSGTSLVYLALIGGSGFDAAFDVVVDGSGNAYLTGATTSAQPSFPVVLGPDLTFNGIADAWVAKVNPTGTGLLFSGYVGGSGIDFAEGVVIDASRNVFLTGPTESSEATFPTVVGPDLTYNGGFDTFVAKMKANPGGGRAPAQAFLYSGYIGGSGDDIGVLDLGGDTAFTSGHVAIDSAGNAYVSGITDSAETTFPDGDGFGALPGPDVTHNGGDDAYVAKVNATGSALAYAGYIGGATDDRGFGMGVDSTGAAYLTGNTTSDQTTFPVVLGPDLTYNGETDTFVAKVAPNGLSLVYCGYLGGTGFDQGHGLALDGSGAITVIGHTHSADYPALDGPDLTYNGAGENGDAFVTRVKPVPSAAAVLSNLVFSGFIGGSGEDAAFWVRVDGGGNSYVVGDTDSTESTFPDGDGFGAIPGFDQTSEGAFDAFVLKISKPGR